MELPQHPRMDFVEDSRDGGLAGLNGSEITRPSQQKKNLMPSGELYHET